MILIAYEKLCKDKIKLKLYGILQYNLFMESKQGTKMDTMTKLAMAYAAALVEYYATKKHCETSELHVDKMALLRARDEMFDAANELAVHCESVATL